MERNSNENRHTIKSILASNDITSMPIYIKFDLMMLNMIIAFIYKDSVLRTRKALTNIRSLFSNLDMSLYDSVELTSRIWIILKTLEGRLDEGFENPEILQQYCLDDAECDEYKASVIETISQYKISHEESKYLIKKVDDALTYGYIQALYKIVKARLEDIADGDFKSYKSLESEIYEIALSIMAAHRKFNSIGSDYTFSLDPDVFEQIIEDAVTKLKDRNRVFITGIQRLNTILSPGYMSKKLYTYLAFPGKGKSTILLKSALDIRKYNKGIQTKDPDKRPAILFLNLENGYEETVERMYNMLVESDDIRNYTPKQVMKKLKDKGGLKLTEENNIDIIIKEYKNRELSTNDLYTIIDDLADEGIEVITLIVDYLKRIRPFEKALSEKEELKNITNELKEIAKHYDIPVITAQQLNRSGASVVDAAIQANKEDVTRLVGRDSVAGAWEIIENSDWVCIVNPEVQRETNKLFFIFKRLKRRYRSIEESEKLRRLEYFAHPFEENSEIRLVDDIDLPKPVSVESLSTQFDPVKPERGQKNAVEREDKSNKKTYGKPKDVFECDPFDFETTANY